MTAGGHGCSVDYGTRQDVTILVVCVMCAPCPSAVMYVFTRVIGSESSVLIVSSA